MPVAEMLKINEICAGYGARQVLFEVSAELNKGDIVSVIGPNGCGKSTLLRAMAGLIKITSGDVMIDGAAASDLSRNEVAKRIAYLPQGKSTPDMTVEQMVLHGRFPYLDYPRRYSAADRRIALEAMRAVGVDSEAERPLCALSGGMRQNAYIAMALAQSTDYVLLDEPTTYLDASHQISLMDTLCALARSGKGIVAVLHDIPLALGYSDKVLLMSEGRAVAFGTPDEILRSGLIEKIFGISVLRDANGGYYTAYKR